MTEAPELSAAGLIQAYEKRWAIEIVSTYMKKRGGLSFGARGDDVPNLHLVVGDDDAIDQQSHPWSVVGTRELIQGRLHLLALTW